MFAADIIPGSYNYPYKWYILYGSDINLAVQGIIIYLLMPFLHTKSVSIAKLNTGRMNYSEQQRVYPSLLLTIVATKICT